MSKRKNKKSWLFCLLLIPFIALGWSLTISADSLATQAPKEEVVYVTLADDGQVDAVYVVNMFDHQGGLLEDFGAYSDVQNMTTTDQIEQADDRITIETSAAKLFYQGTLKDPVLPWQIQFTYTLDGQKLPAAALAGRSGDLRIDLQIRDNPAAQGSFYDDFALQVAVTLDMSLCKNIVAEGATIVNVGQNKQLSYTALPGQGLSATITTTVSDFAMEPITISALRLALSIDFEASSLTDMDEWQDGAGQLNDGMSDLVDGMDELADGSETLVVGAEDLASGATLFAGGVDALAAGLSQLDSGMDTLLAGGDAVQDGLTVLAEAAAQLSSGSDAFAAALAALQAAVDQLGDGLEALSGLDDLVAGSAAVQQGLNGLADGLNLLQGSLRQIDASALIDRNNQAVATLSSLAQQAGNESLNEVIVLLNQNNQAWGAVIGVQQIANQLAADDLAAQYGQIHGSLQQLADSLQSLAPGVQELQSAVAILVTEYAKLDGGQRELAAGLAEVVTGYRSLHDGMAATAGGLREIGGATGSLRQGGEALVNGSASLAGGLRGLAGGTAALLTGSKEMQGGTEELYDRMLTIDGDMQAMIDEALDALVGGDDEPVSYVSEKNSKVKSVQFVMTTAAIREPTAPAAEEPDAATVGVWQRFLALFH